MAIVVLGSRSGAAVVDRLVVAKDAVMIGLAVGTAGMVTSADTVDLSAFNSREPHMRVVLATGMAV